MSDESDDKLSLTVLGDALENGIPIDDPEVIALARAAERRKKQTLWYRIKQKFSDNLPAAIWGGFMFLSAIIGTIITLWSKT